ncbi:arsenite methyltransferase [Botrimarina hoheduenensis]|uniref:Arsenite methyltransferase n=1 Tax=Botrimarina hoheduenensis TaxID=2528000 RepID=A0A5C5WD48_9BACT|nr:arsenite methyltransferase [Botrimarina hoheduenensis]TWT48417.1 putative methyltransferase YcgJ [Botrimarina hoheduenensis]
MSDPESLLQQVRKQYSAVAGLGLSSDHAGVRSVAEAFGYSAEELASIPAEANMGLSCGNPLATALLHAGEVVVDLGCGGGLDVLLAAPKVGPTGKAIGIDMSQEMVNLARRNAEKKGLANVEFHQSTIDKLPLAEESVDCVISNCVINLAPDKGAVLREVFRVLKPGGRVAVSDIALKQPLPAELATDLSAYIGCIAGAIPIEAYRQMLIDTGFGAVEVLDTGADLNAYAKAENAACCVPAPPAYGLPVVEVGGCCGSPNPSATSEIHSQLVELLTRYDVNEFAASVRIYAIKSTA